MKIFGWMQSKLNTKQGNRKQNSVSAHNHMLQQPCKEEFSDLPHGLLAIGTFGNNNLKEDPERCNLQGSQASCQDHLQDISAEEVGEIQKELKLLLNKQVSAKSKSSDELETLILQLRKFFNCPSSVTVDRTTSETGCDDSVNKDSCLTKNSCVVNSTGKDIRLDNTNNAIHKKSVSFLLKKTFLSRSGFTPNPSFQDSVPESRMEKIFRAILHKKVYPQSSSPKATVKKYLDNKHVSMTENEEEMLEKKENDGSKWVKTDSEFIILEI